jgi:hypothetical protein
LTLVEAPVSTPAHTGALIGGEKMPVSKPFSERLGI